MLWWEQDIFILTEAMQDSFEIGHVQCINILNTLNTLVYPRIVE